MGPRASRITLGFVLTAVLCLGTVFASSAAADTAGTVHYLGVADSSFDKFTSKPAPATQEWFNSNMWRMVAYSPYFDSRTSWYTKGWVYDDSYAIYKSSSQAIEHPEWILKDAAGKPLYIPSGCSGGTCPQYAGDISNPAFRQAWIDEAKAEVAQGYKGIFIDDVNMEMQVSNGAEQAAAPIDRSTGEPMSADAWRGYMAQFMQEVRAQLPDTEIAHNVIWFADDHAGISNPSIRTETESANYIFLERGVNDGGLTGGEGQWSKESLLSYVDQVHALGRSVVLDGTAGDTQGLAYNLASYFLVSNGQDAVRGGSQTPESWWSGWSKNLGQASGPRYTWSHLLRRDFSEGMALVNPPGEPTETVSLPVPMQDAEGNTVTSVTLPAASGAILTAAPPVAAALESASTTEASSVPPASIEETKEAPALTPAQSSRSTSEKAVPLARASHHNKHAASNKHAPWARISRKHARVLAAERAGRRRARVLTAHRRRSRAAHLRRHRRFGVLRMRRHRHAHLARSGRR